MLEYNETLEKKQIFIDLLQSISSPNDDIEGLINYLEENGFFGAPASTKYHCSYYGGLCEHSINVYCTLEELVQTYIGKDVSKRTIVILGLLHDIAKMDYYEQFTKNVKNESTNQWEKVVEYRVVDGRNRPTYGSNAFNNYMAISRFISLSDEEIVALINYNCGMDDNYSNKDLSTILSKNPLVVLLHSADMICTYIDEQ